MFFGIEVSNNKLKYITKYTWELKWYIEQQLPNTEGNNGRKKEQRCRDI